MSAARLSLDELVAGIESGDRTILGRALTLVESDKRSDIEETQDLLERLLPKTGGAHRIAISGVPGVGKSTLIDTLGMHALEAGRSVAVLTIDPSSGRSGGSILGDKTRMTRLSRDESAFVRPSPNRGVLGGVARTTRESILVFEAAGYDMVVVETVGVGQAELTARSMVDTFCVLMLPNAGDELQGIKRGILEHADLVVVNKADGQNEQAAEVARQQYVTAMHLAEPLTPAWRPEVLTTSAQTEAGIPELLLRLTAHRAALRDANALEEMRAEQAIAWLWSTIDHDLCRRLREHPDVDSIRERVEADVRHAKIPATRGALCILAAFG